MFEQELEQVQKITIGNTIGNAPSIALKTILESNIPAGVKSYFRGHVEWMLHTERRDERKDSRFDYRQEDVRLLQEQMDILLVYHYTFSREEFLTTLDTGAHFLFNFLCRPQWTLDQYLFEEKNMLSVRETALKFRFLGDYGYYWSILERYLTGKNMTEISREEMARLLRRIDTEIVNTKTKEDLACLTEPFYDFIRFIHQHAITGGRGDLPVRALMYFFEDKRIPSVLSHLQSLRDAGRQSLSYEELQEAVFSSYIPKVTAAEEFVAEQSRPAPSPQRRQHEQLPISDREKQSIVRSLFAGDESRYRVTLENVLSSDSWDDAGLSLDHYFTMNDVDPFSRDAIVLTNALQSYFTNRHAH